MLQGFFFFLSKRNKMGIHYHFIKILDSETHLSYYTSIRVYPNFKYPLKYPSAYIINNSGVFNYEGGIHLKVSVLILKDSKSEMQRPGSCSYSDAQDLPLICPFIFGKYCSLEGVGFYPISQMGPSQSMREILVHIFIQETRWLLCKFFSSHIYLIASAF